MSEDDRGWISSRIPPVTVTTDPAGNVAAFGLAGTRRRVVVQKGEPRAVDLSKPGWHLRQLGRALSRLLNSLRGGEGDTTYSAGSYVRMLAGSRFAAREVVWVDRLNGETGHCYAAWVWHRDHGLLAEDSPG
jgi:hypothetical protein